MKYVSFAAAALAFLFLASFSALAQQGKYPNKKFRVSWANPKNDFVVLMCDETYYPAVDVIVPGVAGKDFDVEFSSIHTGKYPDDCDVKTTQFGAMTLFTIDTNGTCSVLITKKGAPGQVRKSVAYEIHDAC